MKKHFKDFIILLFVLFVGCNIVLNHKARPLINKFSPGLDYMFVVSFIPDRIIFVDFYYINASAPLLTLDLNIMSLLAGDYARAVDGISATGLTLRFLKGVSDNKERKNAEFVIPFCRYLKLSSGSIMYDDPMEGVNFGLTGINGKSVYNASEKKTEERMVFDCSGYIQGRKNDGVGLKFYFYPYKRNVFNCNLFGTKINVKAFEPLFKKNNLKIESGSMNFLVQIKGERRKIHLNNFIEINGLKIREETGLDLKALFNVSYEQIGNYLTDSNGNLYVDFDFSLDDSEFMKLPEVYAEKFADNVGGRIKTGVVTAPVRGVADLIWNLTGENIFRVFRLFGGE